MGNIPVEYEVTDEGRRKTQSSVDKITMNYLLQGGLLPYHDGVKMLDKIEKVVLQKIDLNTPAIVCSTLDLRNEVFSSILLAIRKLAENMYKNITYKVVDVSELRSAYFSNEQYDISVPFDMYNVLFVPLDDSVTPHMYNSFCVVEVARLRKLKGKYTFFFYQGTASSLSSDRWCLDINGLGSSVESEKKVLERITNYISYVDLNKLLK